MNTVEKAMLVSVIVIFLTFIALLGYSRYLQGVIDELLDKQKETQQRYLETIGEFVKNYNELQNDYNELYVKYHKLASEKGFWDKFLVTAYNANDLQQGTNNITSIGINLDKDWTKYFNLCAVDPEVIPYGSILAIRFSDGDVRYFLAVDCGEAIRGKHIDILYMNKDRAIEFGEKELEVKILK